MSRKSYGDLRKQMDSLIAQQERMEQKTAHTLVRSIMSSDAGAKLAALSAADLRAVTRLLVDSLDGLIARAQSDKRARQAATAPAEPPKPAPTDAPPRPATDSADRPIRFPGYIAR